ncbi:pentatricopeptide repeat-containing protein At2g17210 [Diospyros lotus]|uniref:pentatricopeptide repeat-containing protein At2g17210 n=1 Tax=Diospyros lotus TaxID=55363 RepID=UPI00224D9332|nr:pentatricopeptide repeat-containing protein At2g17210 [Diospyros lotus]
MRFPIASPSSKLANGVWRIKESSSSSSGKWHQGFTHFRNLNKAGVRFTGTDPSLFHPILKSFANLSFKHGESVHACFVKQGLESFSSIGNSLMDFYMKSGALSSALGVFDSTRNKDSVSWNIVIHGHLVHGALQQGMWMFLEGRVAGFEPNNGTLVLVIHACRSLKATYEGLKLHAYLVVSGFWAIASVQNSLLSMYADIEMESAGKLFDEMSYRDLISWSVMIGGYLQSEEAEVAFGLFREIVTRNEFEVDEQLMVNVIKACVHLGELSIGRLVHGFVILRAFNYDPFVGNSLIDMYSKCHDTESALKAFMETPSWNIVSWNSLLSGFVSDGKYSEAQMVFDSMQKAGAEADEVTLVNLLQAWKHFLDPVHCKSIHSVIVRRGYENNYIVINSLIDAYSKCNLIRPAWNLFNLIKRRDTVTWSTMIAGFTRCGMPDEALYLFQEMSQVENKPNAITLLNLLEACSVSAELKRSKSAHGIAVRRGLAGEVAVGTAIVDMYSKCGAIKASEKVFDQIPQKNIVSWSAMVAAYGMNGLPRGALALIGKMKAHGLKPNPVTTLSVLSACSHGGLIEEGLSFFKELVQDQNIELKLEHYSCVVDLLGRAGKLDCAMELIKSMPNGFKAGASAWGALLSACRSQGNNQLGADALSHILELEPSNSAGYLLASSMYAANGSWVDAARMRWLAKERRVGMVSGYSLVHVNNKACKFVAGDKSHQSSGATYLLSEQLHACMRKDKRLDEPFFD